MKTTGNLCISTNSSVTQLFIAQNVDGSLTNNRRILLGNVDEEAE